MSRPQSVKFTEVNTGYKTPCWLWDGSQSADGYGYLARGGYRGTAHGYFYRKTIGPVPEGLELDHKCDVKLCCNPTHVHPVTHKENIRRSRVAKLSPDKVRAIKTLYEARKFTQRQIAKLYSITQAQVSHIVNGKQWSEIS
jgi:HNH endonuclease/Helix-turn-helix